MFVHKCKNKTKINLPNQSLKIRPQNLKVIFLSKLEVKAKK
jgi:hypothetical protein